VAPIPVTLADNRQAERRLILAFLGITLVMALIRTLLMQVLANGPITLITVSTLCAAYAWPVVPVVAVIRRWSRWRFVGTLLLWFVAAVALLSWRTNENVSFAQVFGWMLFDIGLPLIVVTALCLGSATRPSPLAGAAVHRPVLGFAGWCRSARGAGRGGKPHRLLAGRADRGRHGHRAVRAGAWLIAWWPARAIGRWLGKAYAARRISELFYLFTVWIIALTGPALGAIASEGWGALLYFLPLLWIPLGGHFMARRQRPAGRPPTLLVLRVFRQDANVQDLFDRVIERWRLTGNTVLIAGTDLAERTIDADDIFTFLDGRLAERFIQRPEDVSHRLGNFEWRPDAEGATGQRMLLPRHHLAAGAGRTVESQRRGADGPAQFCRHQPGLPVRTATLAATPGLHRVVVLINERTELRRCPGRYGSRSCRAFRLACPAGQPAAGHRRGSRRLVGCG
jgi:hypothetical protein